MASCKAAAAADRSWTVYLTIWPEERLLLLSNPRSGAVYALRQLDDISIDLDPALDFPKVLLNRQKTWLLHQRLNRSR